MFESRSHAGPATPWKIVRWNRGFINVNNTDCRLIGTPSITLKSPIFFFCTESQYYIYGCNLQRHKTQNEILLIFNLAKIFRVLIYLWVIFFLSMYFIFLIAAIQLNAALKISIPLQSHSKLTAGRTLASCLSFNFGFRIFKKMWLSILFSLDQAWLFQLWR